MNVKAYREWLEKEDFYYKRFDLLATKLEEFLLNYRLTNPDFTNDVASKFKEVLASCDEIDYQEDSTATAYGILHFLPRFRRFQMTFGKLVDKQVLPIGAKPINSLDIGTGPGPSLYALSDTYKSLKTFGTLNQIPYLKGIDYMADYVEQSSGFRNWLHHFTEVANSNIENDDDAWTVPYHHGSFSDFTEIKFNDRYSYTDINYNGDLIVKSRKISYRFNTIVCSNFFTRVSQIESLRNELQDCMRFMRNNGKLIISGGSGVTSKDKNYPQIYERAKSILLENVYGNYKFYAKASYVKVTRNKLSFNTQDRFGKRIIEFNKRILERLNEFNAVDSIPEGRTRDSFIASTKDDYDYEYKWEFHVFSKFARLKHKKTTHNILYKQ